MKIIVAGSRDFKDAKLLMSTLDEARENFPDMEIVSGMARGADRLGYEYAKLNGIKLHEFYPDWDRLGKSAGHRRNEDMAKFAAPDGAVIAFWDGVSPGTKGMIELAKRYKLKIKVIRY